MSFEFYKVVHIVGLVMLFSGLAGLWGVGVTGTEARKPVRLTLALAHGIGLTLLLISGFGQLRGEFPTWVYAKLGLWLFFGASFTLAKRKAQVAGPALLYLWVAAAAVAAWLALFKPF